MKIKINAKIHAFSNINYVSPIHIRYSFNADGADFTERYIEGQPYIGIAVSRDPPLAKEQYQWVRFSFDASGTYPTMTVGQAEKDIEGNVITETYATREEVKEAQSVFNAKTHYDFPSLGKVDVIYKAELEKKIYQWNPDNYKYEVIATYDDTELSGRVTTVEGKVTTLIGSDADKSVRTIANEELAAQLIPESAKESLDTLTEIAAWIQSHPDDAAAMNTAITALQNQLSGIDAGDGTVKRYVDDAIAALKIGDYAKAADLTTLAGRVTTLEGKAHIHSNKALLDTYMQTEADLADAVAKKHEHTNKTVLDGITAEKVTAWDKVSEKANDTDLATIAKTGNVNDLIQTSGDVLVFNCGTSSTNI